MERSLASRAPLLLSIYLCLTHIFFFLRTADSVYQFIHARLEHRKHLKSLPVSLHLKGPRVIIALLQCFLRLAVLVRRKGGSDLLSLQKLLSRIPAPLKKYYFPFFPFPSIARIILLKKTVSSFRPFFDFKSSVNFPLFSNFRNYLR